MPQEINILKILIIFVIKLQTYVSKICRCDNMKPAKYCTVCQKCPHTMLNIFQSILHANNYDLRNVFELLILVKKIGRNYKQLFVKYTYSFLQATYCTFFLKTTSICLQHLMTTGCKLKLLTNVCSLFVNWDFSKDFTNKSQQFWYQNLCNSFTNISLQK